jgi:hypothetical protein
MNTALATAKAVLTIPGTVAQQLHPPAVTLGAFYTALASIIVALAPELPVLHDYLVTLFGPVLAPKLIAGITIAAAIIATRSTHVAATGRSIVPAVDNATPQAVSGAAGNDPSPGAAAP